MLGALEALFRGDVLGVAVATASVLCTLHVAGLITRFIGQQIPQLVKQTTYYMYTDVRISLCDFEIRNS